MTDPTLMFDPVAEARRNWVEHEFPHPDAMTAVISITRAHQIILRRADAVLRPLELTFARYEALVLLSFTRNGSMPLGKMGQRLQVHAASVTNVVDRLEQSGYVRRTAHPDDGRATLAELTDAGREVMRQATQQLGEIRFGAAGLDDDDAKAVTDRLTAFRRRDGDFVSDGDIADA